MAMWTVKPEPGGRISAKAAALDGANLTLFFTAQQWEEIKWNGDRQLWISQLRLEHGVEQ